MKSKLAVLGLGFLLVGCAKPPPELRRVEQLDAECGGRGVAYAYPIASGTAITDRAAKAGCYPPVGAWTEPRDQTAGGTRKTVYELREKEKQTLLCCKA
jgi:hypothetical protein